MPVTASAPGKLVLIGEYVVLEGAPAVVLAVDRRARVCLRDSEDSDWHIDAPDLGIRDARGRLNGAGRLDWLQLAQAQGERLALVARVLEAAQAEGETIPAHVVLDTQAFFADDPAHSKLGLGSSAALAVALSGAVHAHNQRGTPELAALRLAHCQAQGGRGSGLDIATSLAGGVLIYCLHNQQPYAVPSVWPETLELCCVWSGTTAHTGTFLQRLDAWRERSPSSFAALMSDLGALAEEAAKVIMDGNTATLIDVMAAYASALDALGQASGLDIVCNEHRAIGAVATACGVTYKTSGAGGGDAGIAVSDDAERIRHFRQRVADAGFMPLDLKPDMHGLRVKLNNHKSKDKKWISAT